MSWIADNFSLLLPATTFLITYAGVAVGGIPGLPLASTFAGNLLTIGSIANLIVIEQARQCGIRIGFREHARVGIPVTHYML
jgi:Na+/H+ antiporter NhaD/arsenite permease-like protein